MDVFKYGTIFFCMDHTLKQKILQLYSVPSLEKPSRRATTLDLASGTLDNGSSESAEGGQSFGEHTEGSRDSSASFCRDPLRYQESSVLSKLLARVARMVRALARLSRIPKAPPKSFESK